MASKATTTFSIKAVDETKQGIQSAESSFKQFTSSIDSITGGLGSKITGLLANPWTAVAASIGATVKVTKELWSAGLDAQTGFEQLQQAFGDYAAEVDGMLDAIDRTTLATKDDLESMAKRISQYGLSTEELQGVLQTTADIAIKTGQSFGTVESAIVSAMSGQDKALNKLVPEWKDYKEGAEDAAAAIVNLGKDIHESTVQIQSGSIAQTLDNMSSSWTNIKENLGQTLVLNIQSSGVLQTICSWLEKIEEHTSSRAARAAAQPEIDLLNKYKSTSEYSMLLEAGLVSPETVQLLLSQSDVALATHTNYGLLTKTQYDMYQTALNRYRETHPVSETPTSSGINTAISEASASWLAEYETFMSVGKTHWVSGVGIQTDLSWISRIMSGDWTGVTDSDWDKYYDLLLRCPEDQKWEGMMDTYQKDRLAYELWKNTPASVQLNWGVNEDPLTRHYRLQHTGTVGVISHEGEVYDPVLGRWKKSKETLDSEWSSEGKMGYRESLAYNAQFVSHTDPATALWKAYQEGTTTFEEMIQIAEDNNISMQEFEKEIVQIQEEKADARFKEITEEINEVIGAIGSLYSIWRDGYQAGDIGSSLSQIGSLIPGKTGTILSLVGVATSLVEGVIDDLSNTTSVSYDDAVATQVASYNGSTVIHMNFNFNDVNFIAEGGIDELAALIRTKIQELEYTSR